MWTISLCTEAVMIMSISRTRHIFSTCSQKRKFEISSSGCSRTGKRDKSCCLSVHRAIIYVAITPSVREGQTEKYMNIWRCSSWRSGARVVGDGDGDVLRGLGSLLWTLPCDIMYIDCSFQGRNDPRCTFSTFCVGTDLSLGVAATLPTPSVGSNTHL